MLLEQHSDWLTGQLDKLLGAKTIWKLDTGGVPSVKLMGKLQGLYEQGAKKFGRDFGYSFGDIVRELEERVKGVTETSKSGMTITTGGGSKLQAETMRRAAIVAETVGSKRPTSIRIGSALKKVRGDFEKVKDAAVKQAQQSATAASATTDAYREAAGGTTKMGLVSPNTRPVRSDQALVTRDTLGHAPGRAYATGTVGRKIEKAERLRRVGKAMATKAKVTKNINRTLGAIGIASIMADFLGKGLSTYNQAQDINMQERQVEAMGAAQSPESMYYEAMLPQMQQQTAMGHQAIMQRLVGGGGGGGMQLAEGEMQI